MKNCVLITMAIQLLTSYAVAQDNIRGDLKMREINTLIDNYSLARDKKDTALLKNILTNDVDQLVSSGEWRIGIGEAVRGMLQSSETNPGSRRLTVEKIRFLDPENALADARYEIKSTEGHTRKMWSTFVVVMQQGRWKIAAIRNMMPTAQPGK